MSTCQYLKRIFSYPDLERMHLLQPATLRRFHQSTE
jgi:hypothetical protein